MQRSLIRRQGRFRASDGDGLALDHLSFARILGCRSLFLLHWIEQLRREILQMAADI